MGGELVPMPGQVRLGWTLLAVAALGGASARQATSSGNDPYSTCGSCANPGEYLFGVACGDTTYTLRLGNVTTSASQLPTPSGMSSAIAGQCDIADGRVKCEQWTGSTITCKIKDQRGVHSATYMLRYMARQAGN